MTNTWSPFDCLVVADQTQSGLLKRGANEVDVVVMENIELRSANTEQMVPLNASHAVDTDRTIGAKWVDKTENLMVQITTHRIVFWKTKDDTTQSRSARFLHHSQVINASPETLFFKSPKLLLNTAALGDLYLVFPKDKVRLRDDALTSLQKALSRNEWEQPVLTSAATSVSRATRRVGVDAVLTQNARRHQQAAKLTDTAFLGDAETLLREAQELVLIIHKYVATLDRQQESGGTEDTAQLVGMLQHMGMTAAVSKSDFQGGRLAYVDQVARELADFIRPKLAAAAAVMTLTDVYCLFNRARGSHLLSPEDLIAAAHRLTELHLGMSVHVFPSGLIVLQEDARANPEKMAERLRDLLSHSSNSSLTAVDVSRKWHISAVLAMEQLQAVERLGYLVRDETLEGLRFYPNRFNEWCT
jgi:ESCRT-II complex subunit VPS36